MGVWWNVDTPELESGTSNGVRVRVSPSPLTLLFEQMSWLVWNQLNPGIYMGVQKIFQIYLYIKNIFVIFVLLVH